MKRTLVLFLFVVGFSVGVFAKAPTVALSITGPGFNEPLHLSSPDVTGVNVWIGDFANLDTEPLAAPPTKLPRYAVHFWVHPPRTTVQMKYVIDFVWDADQEKGYIHLPGRPDVRYFNNSFTISRSGQDGHWFNADDTWSRAVWTEIAQKE